MDIIFVSTRPHECWRNRNSYQKLKHLGEYADTHYVGKFEICEELADNLKSLSIVPSWLNWLNDFLFPLWALYCITRIKRNRDVALVYTAWGYGELVAGYFSTFLGLRWVADIWDNPYKPVVNQSSYRTLKAKLTKGVYQIQFLIIKKILKKSDATFAFVNPQMLIDVYNLPKEKVWTFTNGVDLSLDYRVNNPSNAVFTFVFVGFLMRNRISTLIDAAIRLKQNDATFKLLLIGPEGRQADIAWLNKVIHNNGLDEVIERTGPLPHSDVLRQLQDADVCISPYDYSEDTDSAYPIKILEYMAMGKPIIATNLWGTRQLVEDNRSGLLVEAGDPIGLCNAMLRLRNEPTLRASLAQNAKQRSELFDWRLILQKLNPVLDHLSTL